MPSGSSSPNGGPRSSRWRRSLGSSRDRTGFAWPPTRWPPSRSARRQTADPSWSRWPSPRRSCATRTRPAIAGTRSSPTCSPTGVTPSTNRRHTAPSSTTCCARRFEDVKEQQRADRVQTTLQMLWADELLENQSQMQTRPPGVGRSLRPGEAPRRPDLSVTQRRPGSRRVAWHAPTKNVVRVPARRDGGYSRRLGGDERRRSEVPMGLRLTYRRRVTVAAAAIVCGPLLTVVGAADRRGAPRRPRRRSRRSRRPRRPHGR